MDPRSRPRGTWAGAGDVPGARCTKEQEGETPASWAGLGGGCSVAINSNGHGEAEQGASNAALNLTRAAKIASEIES